MIDYRIYDVFTDMPFGGNPLAVVPDATGLAEADLQKVAHEFNFSETAFVYPPQNAAHTAKVRIFTPTTEVPFAGHPTIGTAIALRDLGHRGDMVLELGIGPIPCTLVDGGAAFTTKTPLEHLSEPDIALVAAALDLPQAAINTATHPPTQASLGLPFVFVELTDDDALNSCNPVIDRIKEGAARYPAGDDFAIFVYTRDNDNMNARMFAPLDRIPEDPATGSAAATLAALLTQIHGSKQHLTIIQGVAMGRPSRITVQTTLSTPTSVRISGTAVCTMIGQLI